VERLKAVRHGSRVDVSWRTDRKADRNAFVVLGLPGRTIAAEGAVGADAKAVSDRRFTARLTGANEVRYVYVFAGAEGEIGGPYVTKVR
jgi:hypothetical protein